MRSSYARTWWKQFAVEERNSFENLEQLANGISESAVSQKATLEENLEALTERVRSFERSVEDRLTATRGIESNCDYKSDGWGRLVFSA